MRHIDPEREGDILEDTGGSLDCSEESTDQSQRIVDRGYPRTGTLCTPKPCGPYDRRSFTHDSPF